MQQGLAKLLWRIDILTSNNIAGKVVVITGASRVDRLKSITEPDVAEGVQTFYKEIAIPAQSFAQAVAYAMSQPEEVDINELLFRPPHQEL